METTTADNQPHLLVVDDSRLMRRAIVKILGKEYRLTEASDGEEGWKTLQAHDDIKVIFSDLSMPNLDGYGLLERIRNSNEPRIKNTPVIIITGAEDDEETKQLALSKGASDFISKPFESVQLRTRAKTHVRLDDTHRQLNETVSLLEKQTSRDVLTGLANKNHFLEQGNKDLAFAKRHRGELSLLLIQIDNFNKLFTGFGKEAALHALKEVSRIMAEGVRHEDTVARIGVAQLAFLTPSTNRIGARQFGERIRKQIEGLNVEFDGIALPTTISVGIAAINITRDTSLDDILKVANRHLANAINNGGNRVVLEEARGTVTEETTAVAEDTAAVTPETAAVAEVITTPPLPEEPDLETAVQLCQSDEVARMQPYLAALLRKLYPLLQLCNSQLQLGIDDALTKIRQRLDK
jgi:two-component system cell cycle response regulator